MSFKPNGEPQQRAPFTTDEPVALDRDAFGHVDYARSLATMVRDEQPPLTIGVFGSWGVGKSTIIAGLREELGDEVAFAYFDAWRYEEDSLRRQFLRDVGRDLKRDNHLHLKDFDPDKDLSELDLDEQHTEEGFSLSWPRAKRALVIGLAIGLMAWLLIELGAITDFVKEDEFGKRFVPAAGAAVVAFLAGLFSQWIHITQRVVTIKSLTDPDRFQAKFVDMIKAVRRERLVVAIDNVDRCSPERAVAMLSTIKTYLEPAVEPPASRRPKIFSRAPAAKHVVFIVAVDHEALRRHLLAQEVSHSEDSGREEAERYVDEYLAKFFSVRVPIRPILTDDMRAYVGEHLGTLIERRGYGEERTRLISLVSTALRRNPRRIKQFVNDLEARLRLLEEREKTPPDGQPGIAAPVSKDILMVAKLALIESEWPAAFERLGKEPRRLAEWHSVAERHDEVWIADGEPDSPTPDERQAARTFAAFLRASRPISSIHVRALIDLKQAPAEAGLAGFAEFRQAVISGERAEAERLLEATPDADRPRYAARLTQVLKDELNQGDLDAARAVVDAALSVEAVSAHEPARTEVLETALDSPQLREQLRQLDPGPAVEAGRTLPSEKRDQLHAVFVARMLDENEPEDSQQRAGDALAGVASDLSEQLRKQIREGLAGEAIQEKFLVYARLAEAEPRVLPAGAARKALDAISSPGESGAPSLGWDDEADRVKQSIFSVLLAALRPGRQADIEQPAVDQVIQSLSQAEADHSVLARVIDRGRALVDAMESVDPSHAVRLAEHVQQRWNTYPVALWPALVRFLASVLDNATEESRSGIAAQVMSQVFSDPTQGIGFLGEMPDLPELFRDPAAAHLSGLLSQPGHRDSAAAALNELAPADLGQRFSDAVVACVQNGDFDGASFLIDHYTTTLGAQGTDIADNVLNRADELAASQQPVPFAVLARLARWMDDAQTARFADMVSAQFAAARPEGPTAVAALLERKNSDRVMDRVLETVLSNLEAMPQISDEHMPMLALVTGQSDRIDASRLDGLVSRLEVWISEQPDQRVGVAQQIGRLANLTANQRERLVRFLIGAEKSEQQQPVRLELLRAAESIQGRSKSRAASALDKRLGELKKGSEDDQALARQLSPSEG